MSDHCRDFGERGYNMPGCRDGEVWLDDPRCAPYCRGASMTKGIGQADNIMFIFFIVAFIVLILVIWAFWFNMSPRPTASLYPWQF